MHIREMVQVAEETKKKARAVLEPYFKEACEAVTSGSTRQAEALVEVLDSALEVMWQPAVRRQPAALRLTTVEETRRGRKRLVHQATIDLRGGDTNYPLVPIVGESVEEATRGALLFAVDWYIGLIDFLDPTDAPETLDRLRSLAEERLKG